MPLVIVAVVLCAGQGIAAQKQAVDGSPIVVNNDGSWEQRQRAAGALLAKVRTAGSLRVIVALRMTLQQERTLSFARAAVQRRTLRTLQDSVASRSYRGQVPDQMIARFRFVPAFSIWVNPSQLETLLSDLRVQRVQEDVLATTGASPATTWPLSGIDVGPVWARAFKGRRFAVAVLDDGFAYRRNRPEWTHPMLANRVIAEACFSGNDPTAANPTSLCPNGNPQQIGPGAALNCGPECDHGTAVAALAAGNPSNTSPALSGVAPLANIVAITVLTKTKKGGLVAYGTDILLGLEHVLALSGSFDIAAANLSLEFQRFTQPCDHLVPEVTSIVAQLHDAGIATVAIAGNLATDSDPGIAWPACVPQTIAVAGTDQVGRIWNGSAYSDLVTVLAPASNITVAKPPMRDCAAAQGNCYQTGSGTSYAAPQVAGAFALLKGIKRGEGDRTVEQVRFALSCTGNALAKNNVTKPRIDVSAAYSYLRNSNLDIAPLPNYQNGGFNTYRILENVGRLTFTITREDTSEAQSIYIKAHLPTVYVGGLNRDVLSFAKGAATATLIYRWQDNAVPDLWGLTRGNISFYPTADLARREQCPIGLTNFEIVDDDFTVQGGFAQAGKTLDVTVQRGFGWDWGDVVGSVSTTETEGFTNDNDFVPLDNATVSFTTGDSFKTVPIQTLPRNTPRGVKTFGLIVRNSKGRITGKGIFSVGD